MVPILDKVYVPHLDELDRRKPDADLSRDGDAQPAILLVGPKRVESAVKVAATALAAPNPVERHTSFIPSSSNLHRTLV
jgi:hypothetical protein